MLKALRSGLESTAIRLAVTFGFRDETRLTSLVFYVRHPERGGRPIQKNEPGFQALSREWLDIRDRLVRPVLAGGPVTPPGPTPGAPGSFQPVPVESPGGGRIKDKRDPSPADVVKVPRAGGGAVPLHRLAAQALDAMTRAARAEGIAAPLLLPVSGYRSKATQAKLWQNALAKAGGDEKEARKWVAPPGGSAHQSGRAVDLHLGHGISSKQVAAMRKTAVWQWLERNAVRFGFYPYGTEPWHWEYNPPAVQGESGELGEVFNPNVFIHPRIDVSAQRALMSMAGSSDLEDRKRAFDILAMVKQGLLDGIYQQDQRRPALVARRNNTNWWELLAPGVNSTQICDPLRLDEDPRDFLPRPPLFVFRKNLSRPLLIEELRSLLPFGVIVCRSSRRH